MPRAPNPNPPTTAQRMALSRKRRGVRAVELTATALEHARAIQAARGEATLTAAVVRALEETAARLTPAPSA